MLLRDTLAQHPFCLTVLIRRNQEGLGSCKDSQTPLVGCFLLCFLDENALKIIVPRTLNVRSPLLTNLQVNNSTVIDKR